MKKMKDLKNNKQVRIIVPILIVVLFIAVAWGMSAFGGGETKSIIAKLEVVPVEEGSISEELQITGIVESEKTKMFLSPVNATVALCNVKVGQVVQKGEVLITFDIDDLETGNKQSKLSEIQAQSEKEIALKNNQNLLDNVSAANTRAAELNSKMSEQEATIEGLNNELTQCNTRIGELTTLIEQLNGQIAASASSEVIIDGVTEEPLVENGGESSEESGTDVIDLQQQLDAAMQEQSDIANLINTLTSEIARVSQNLATNEVELAQQEAIIESGDSALSSDQIQVLNISNELAEIASSTSEELLEKAKTGIVAEFDGVISSLQVADGSMVSQGMQLISVDSNEEVGVEIEVPTSEFDKLDVGDAAKVTIKDYTYEGKVSEMNQIATQNATGSNVIGAVIQITNPDDNIFLGVDAKTTIYTESKENILTIPSSVINTATDGDFVYVIEEGIVVKKNVELGISDLDKIEVVSGLNAGDLVVSDLVNVITEGMSAEPNFGSADTTSNTTTKGKMSIGVTRGN